MKNQPAPRVHYATFINEDTGEATPLFLHSRREIDAEIDQRIRSEPDRSPAHEATRARWHAVLATKEAAAA